MDPRPHTTRISVYARDFSCEGDLAVPAPGGYRGRVYDVLNAEGPFVALTDVVLFRPEDGDPEGGLTCDTLLVRKDAIDYVIPFD